MSLSGIKVAEHFYSIQGEGMTSGVPAVFLRMSMCNFNCSWCDTVDVWTTGGRWSFQELDGVFERKGYYKEISKGAHLILTGGDPMIQQELLTGWFNYLDSIGRNSKRFFIEVETQGYIQPNAQFARKVHLWNVSPKLENSGVSDSKRFQRSVLEWHASANSCFKFPVRHQADLKEVEKIVRSCRIKRSRVYLMPVCDTQSEFLYLAPEVVRIAKLSGFCFSPRLQLVLWDKATGV